jgi:hypothetical protein
MNGEQAEPLELETWMQDVHQFSGGWVGHMHAPSPSWSKC